MNNLKKEISSGAFTLRFLLSFIIVSLIGGLFFKLIQTPLQKLKKKNMDLLEDNKRQLHINFVIVFLFSFLQY